MFVNTRMSRSGCFRLLTKCHRAFDESLRSGCVASNKKSANKCFQAGIVLPLIEIRKKRKTVNLAVQILGWELNNQPGSSLDGFPRPRGLVILLLLIEGQRKALQRMPALMVDHVPMPRGALWRRPVSSCLQKVPWAGGLTS